ncbi:MAG: hypothetical protein ACREQA_14020, partial [Candidatus Binatia bacterium]
SYIFGTSPAEGDESGGQKIVSIFGIPLFRTESTDDVPEDPLAPLEAKEVSNPKPEKSDGFFSSIWRALNPFSGRP